MGVGAEAQLDHLARGVLGDEVARRTLGDDGPAVHHDEALAQLLGLVHVVGRDDQRDALAPQPVEPVPQQVAGLGVQSRGGLVEDEQFGDD